MILDYVTLKLIWWFFITALFVLFFVLGGRDFGVCMLLPFVGKTDEERRLLINSVGPTWDGNQVWLITAGGATFAAWPIVYATAFSGLYVALFLVLLCLILRPPGFEFRSKLTSNKWRSIWDYSLFLSGFVPALVFGVGLGNLLLGLPFRFDANLQSHYEGNFFQLLNPFSILFGLAAVTLLALHGGTYLQKKMPVEFNPRLVRSNILNSILFMALFVLAGFWIHSGIQGYQIQSIMDVQQSLIPTTKQVVQTQHSWLANYQHFSALWSLPILTLCVVFLTIVFSLMRINNMAIIMSSLGIIFALLTANAALFPFILPSSIEPNHSITLWDATSSYRTLHYMFWVTIVFLPIVLSYTFWAFRVFRGKVEQKSTLAQPESY